MNPGLLSKIFFWVWLFPGIQLYSANQAISVDSLQQELNRVVKTNELAKACSIAHQISVQLWINGAVDSSLHYSQQTYQWAVEIKDTSFQIKGLTNCAYNCQQKGDLQAAAGYFEKAVALSEKSGDTLQWANSLENLSVIYGSTGLTNYSKSLKLLLQAAKLKEDAKAYHLLPGTYKNISAIFKQVNDSVNREKYLLKSVGLVDQGKVMNPTFQAAVYNEAGRYYTDEKPDYPRAEFYFGKVLEVSEKLNWKKGISVSLSNMANIKELQGDYPGALSLLARALQIKIEISDYYGIVNTHSLAGEIHEKLREYPEAIKHFEKARKLALEKNLSNELNKSYEGLYRVYRRSGDYRAALLYHEKFTALLDSLSGAEHKKSVAELETRYETEKKEQQIETLTAEKEIEILKTRQRNLVIFILGSMLVLILVLTYLVIYQKNLRNKRKEIELTQKLLRSQMNPHFIFNALGTIQNYIYDNKSEDAARYLAKFAKLMRNILESSVHELIPIEQEIETVTNYLTLQQIRSKNHFQFEVQTEGWGNDEKIPPMLAQPFIENSIKHAFLPGTSDGKITVRYLFDDDDVSVIIEDNGVGVNATVKKTDTGHRSYAIRLTSERLSLLNKKNKKTANIEITDLTESGGKGTRVIIRFKPF